VIAAPRYPLPANRVAPGHLVVTQRRDGVFIVETRMPDPCADPDELALEGVLPALRWVVLAVFESRGEAIGWMRRHQPPRERFPLINRNARAVEARAV
jgi:hypothetical protein